MNDSNDSNWGMPYKLPQLSKLAYRTFNGQGFWVAHKEKLAQGYVYITHGFNTDITKELQQPSQSQVAAIDYVRRNEERILQSLFDLLKAQYPVWIENFGVPEEFPELKDIDDLSKALVILNINVLEEQKEDVSYAQYFFICPWDEEHGISVIMHRANVIAHGQHDLSLADIKP